MNGADLSLKLVHTNITSLILSLIKEDKCLDMPSLLMSARSAGQKINVCPVHEYWLDVGHPETLEQADKEWMTRA